VSPSGAPQRAQGAFNLADYNTVAERIAEFRTKHPEGSLQSEILTLPEAFAAHFIAVKAFAYRTPDDERPGVGLAWEPVEGKTSFTRDSELQNAETAAWGRAIVAVLAADTKKGIVSRDEVQARREDQTGERLPPERLGRPAPQRPSRPVSGDEVTQFIAAARKWNVIIEPPYLAGKTRADLDALWERIKSGELQGEILGEPVKGPQRAPGDEKPANPLSVLPEGLETLVRDKRGVFAAGWFAEFMQKKGRLVPNADDLKEIEEACR
jgi:hypothetical protein